MKRALVMLLLASSALADDPSRGRFWRFCSRTDQGRTHRGFQCDDLAFFEAFPASGAGTSGACSTTAPTGAKGEVLTFTRASTGTCTKTASGGLATTGIANGDLVVLSSNVARVEYDSAGTLGLLVESSRTNVNLQSANLADAVYANVGAPTTTANTTVSPDGTTTMATIQDNSAAALEGRSQTVTVTAAQPYTLSVFVKAGTLSSVTVSLDGTTTTCTSLSATTSTRCIVTDASASGVAIVASVTGGTVVGDTGTFIAWGQQVELGLFATSYIPTAAGTVTRSAETASFPFTLPISPLSIAGTRTGPATSASAPGTAIVAVPAVSVGEAANLSLLYGNINGLNCYNNGNIDRRAVFSPGGLERAWCAIDSANGTASLKVQGEWPTGQAMADMVTASGGTASATNIVIGSFGGGAAFANGVISRVCVDPSPARCR